MLANVEVGAPTQFSLLGHSEISNFHVGRNSAVSLSLSLGPQTNARSIVLRPRLTGHTSACVEPAVSEVLHPVGTLKAML